MLSAGVRFEGFTATDWMRMLSLFRPRRPGNEERDPDRPRGGVIAVHDRGRLTKLVHTAVGRLRLDEAQRDWPLGARELAQRHQASWAVVLSAGALETIMDRFGARARRGDDLTTQTLILVQMAREELTAGRIGLWPRRLAGVPIPSAGVVNASLDAVCPFGRTLVVGLFEAGELWTSVALHRSDDGFDWILGPDELRGDMGLLSGDWRRDHRHLSRAIEHRVGPLALGCYAEVGTVRRLAVDPTPGAWARAALVRDLVLSPLPAPLALPLGIDAGRAAFAAVRTLAERADPLGVVGPSLEALRRAVGERDLGSLVGFEPLELIRRLLSRER